MPAEIQPMTKDQATALSELLHQLRPEWSTKSLFTLLGEHRNDHPFGDLTRAAVNVALDPSKRTPGIIFLEGKHWLTPDQAKSPATTAALGNDTSDDCPRHPGTKTWACRNCKRSDPKPDNFAEMVEAARQNRNQPHEDDQ